MDYIFECQKSAFVLENNKCICLGNGIAYHLTASTYSSINFRAMHVSRIYTKVCKELRKFYLYCRVNDFSKSVNF